MEGAAAIAKNLKTNAAGAASCRVTGRPPSMFAILSYGMPHHIPGMKRRTGRQQLHHFRCSAESASLGDRTCRGGRPGSSSEGVAHLRLQVGGKRPPGIGSDHNAYLIPCERPVLQ
jgi:hypothetical protein